MSSPLCCLIDLFRSILGCKLEYDPEYHEIVKWAYNLNPELAKNWDWNINQTNEQNVYKYFTPSNDVNGIYNFNELKIINSMKYISNIYNKNGLIVLRPYNGERTLIIGCGNGRLDYDDIYYDQHCHKGAYTIDMLLVANPCIVGIWDKNMLLVDLIPDNAFELIIFEGSGHPSYNYREIHRLLDKNNLSMSIAMDDGCYYVDSVGGEGECYNQFNSYIAEN